MCIFVIFITFKKKSVFILIYFYIVFINLYLLDFVYFVLVILIKINENKKCCHGN